MEWRKEKGEVFIQTVQFMKEIGRIMKEMAMEF